jgi:conjugal transfer pilin signal peptidase TrbI
MVALTSRIDGVRRSVLALASDPQRRRFAKRAVGLSSIVLAIGIPLGNTVGKTHKIGLDLGEFRCLPWRVYLVEMGRPAHLARGEYVAFIARNGVMGERFEGKLIGKKIAGLPGDRVVIKDDFASVNGKAIGPLTLLSRLGKKSGTFDRTEIVPEGKVFVVGTEPRSYDGRYWSFLDQSYLIGMVRPVF